MTALNTLKDRFVDLHGYWTDDLQTSLEADPDFFGDYLELAEVAYGTGGLDPKTREFVLIAACASVTHLNRAAVAGHVDGAIRHGATRQELLEVLQITSVLGIHAFSEGAPLLIDELSRDENGAHDDAFPRGERYEQIKSDFTEKRGYWDEILDAMVRASPGFVNGYATFSSGPWRRGTLDPMTRELLYVAIDSSTTHLYNAGTRIHARNALRYGATPEQLVQVFQLVSLIGMQSFTMGAPIVMQRFAQAEG